jgi:hypothetical protein
MPENVRIEQAFRTRSAEFVSLYCKVLRTNGTQYRVSDKLRTMSSALRGDSLTLARYPATDRVWNPAASSEPRTAS